MTNGVFDIAVFGSDLPSALLAGLLAERHGMTVVWVADRSERSRLARGFHLSAAIQTRPETWALLAHTVPETQGLMRRNLGAAVERVDPCFVAHAPRAIAAIEHMRHVAAGFGHEFERLPDGATAADTLALQLRDAVRVQRRPAGLADWIGKAGVTVHARREGTISVRRDGHVRFAVEGGTLEAGRTVLADDDAILAFADGRDLQKTFVRHRAATLLTEPAPALPTPVVFDADTGVILDQEASGAIAALGPGDPHALTDAFAERLPAGTSVRLAGRTGFVRPEASDGGPVAGLLRQRKAFVVAGFGPSTLFVVPALARHLADAATEEEAAFFAARTPGPSNARRSVAEFVPGPAGESAA